MDTILYPEALLSALRPLHCTLSAVDRNRMKASQRRKGRHSKDQGQKPQEFHMGISENRGYLILGSL